MKRNRERVANLGTPSQNSAISLPFLVVNTSKKTTIDCSISSDKYAQPTAKTVCVYNVLVSQASRIFPRAHADYGGGRGKGRKNTSGDYCTVFGSNGNVISAFGHAIIT